MKLAAYSRRLRANFAGGRKRFSLGHSLLLAWMVLTPRLLAGPIEDAATNMLAQSGVKGGLVVVAGCQHPELLAGFRAGAAYVVLGLDFDAGRVATARQHLQQHGLYGPVSVMAHAGETLPFADNVVNLLIIANGQAVSDAEIQRVLVPGGRVIRTATDPTGPFELGAAKPWPADRDGWSHYFYDASNNACSHDTAVGPPQGLQWWAGPYSERSHNWVNGTASFVSAGGRTFCLHDEGPIAAMPHKDGGMNWASKAGPCPAFPEEWALVARDAFNGIALWKRPLTGFGNLQFEDVGLSQPTSWNVWGAPLSLNRRIVASTNRVFATLQYRGGVAGLDAASGTNLWEYTPASGYVDELIHANGRVFLRVNGIPAKFETPINSNAVYSAYIETNHTPAAVIALNAVTGAELWQVGAPYVATETLCTLNDKVCFFDHSNVVCLAAATGQEQWRQPAPKRTYYRDGHCGMLFLWDEKAYFFGGNGARVFTLADGSPGWTNSGLNCTLGFGHPLGMRISNGIIYTDWVGRYNALTGAWMPGLGTPALGSTHSRCHRGVATDKFIMGVLFGIEFYDIAARAMVADCRWLRSSCAQGYIPANGLLYHTPDPCACWIGARIRGYHAFAAQAPAVDYDTVDVASRREQGPAYYQPVTPNPGVADWPTYRRDPQRSGSTVSAVATNLHIAWTANLGGWSADPGYRAVSGLTPVVVAEGRVFVSRKDANELVCLNEATGAVLWRYLLPSFVDSPPTVAQGRVVFGCADGFVYCLKGDDGALIWRFRVAPAAMLILHESRPASKWPAHGAVLVEGENVYCTAGNSSFLDGGIQVFKLDLATGNLLLRTRLNGPRYGFYDINPYDPGAATNNPMGYFSSYVDIEGARSDILASDGVDLHMGQTRITPTLATSSKLVEAATGTLTGRRRLQPMNGFLDDTYFHRVGWHYTDQYYGGGNAAGAANAGKLVVFDDEKSYGVQWEGAAAGRYPNHLLTKGTRLIADNQTTANTRKGFDVIRATAALWTKDIPLIVRAMTLAATPGGAGKTLFVAGPVEPTVHPVNFDPYRDRGAAKLRAMAAATGNLLAELDLPAAPVFDGLAAANGRLYLSLVNGSVICLASSNALPTVAITAPTNGTIYVAPANVTVTVNAADTDGMVAQVELRQNGVLVATATNAPYAFTLTGLPKGAYTLQARACDNGGDTRNAALSIRVDSWFGKWQGEHFTGAEIAGGLSDASCDADGDGRCNLIEYALRSNPRAADQSPVYGGRLENGQFVFEAEYLKADPEVEVTGETSTDLVNWVPAAPASAVYVPDGDRERAILRFDAGPDVARLFLRLKVRRLAPP